MKHLNLYIFCVAMGCLCGTVQAQVADKVALPQRLFEEGKTLFDQRAYTAAIVPLQEYLKGTDGAGFGPETDAKRLEAEYMLTSICYEMAKPDRTIRLQDFLDNHPDSHHANRITALLASSYFYDGDNESALDLFNQADLSVLEHEERNDMTYQLARTYLNAGNYEEAGAWLKTLKAISPKYAEDCTYYLAYIDYNEGRLDEARQGFTQVLQNPKYQKLVPYYVADISLSQRKYDEAASLARDYLNSFPGAEHEAEMHRIIGAAAYQQSNFPEAMAQLESYTSATESPRRDALYMLGLSYFRNQVFSKVPATLSQVTTEDDALSQNANLHNGLAYLQLGEKNRARMAFQQAASSNADLELKEQAAYNYALAVHETSYSAFGESVTAFEQFLNDFPHSRYADQVSNHLVDVYTSTRSYDAALKSIERIKNPNARIQQAKTRILFQLGTQAFANTEFDSAIDYFTQSANTAAQLGSTANAYKAEALYWRGESYYRKGEMEQAAKDYNSYLSNAVNRGDETYALAHYNLGYIDFHKKNYAQAQQHFQQFVNLQKENNKQLLADAYNRIGDSYLNRRQFNEAKQYYSRSEGLDAGTGDYALYQQALVAGLQKNYQQKVSLLNNLENRYPTSPYVVNALYEKGRSYVEAENNAQAINVYKQLVSRFPESALSRKAAAEIGLLYYQGDDYNNAISAYRQVIEKYPGSEEARLALRDLKSLYVDADRVDEFTALAAQLPDAVSFQPGEQDSLSYIAAERVFMRGDIAAAKNSLTRYLQSYPEGGYRLNAHHYLSEIAKQQKDEEGVLQHTTALLEYPENSFSEEALSARGDIYYNRQQYTEALADYKRLFAKSSAPATRQAALLGAVRSAAKLNDAIEVINQANTLLEGSKLSPEVEAEARYLRAKAYLSENAADKANADLQLLATDTRTIQGAEAKYLLAQQLYDQGSYAQAEKELVDFIDQSTPHAYWLARGFVLLSDVYAKTDKKLEAREYLLSLQQNYQADDDIQEMINSRLEQLK